MSKAFSRLLVAALVLAPSIALAQVPGLIPPNTLMAGPPSGSASALPAPRALVAADLTGAGTAAIVCAGAGSVAIYTGSAWQCSTAAASSAHFGILGSVAEPLDFWIARPSATAGTVLQMQDGKAGNLRTLTGANATGINFQSLVDTTVSGNTYASLSLDAQCQAGTSGSCTGINIVAQVNTAWTPGAGALPGANGAEVTGKSTRGGHVWGGDFTGWCLTVAAVECYGIEANVQNDIASTAQASGLWIVNKNSVVPTAGSAALISATASNVGFPTAGIYFSTVAGFSPLTTGASILLTDAITVAHGINLTSTTCSADCWVSNGSKIDGSGSITGLVFKVGANQVVGARVTGYAAMTGTPDKASAFATSTVTLAQLAGRVMQLQADFTTHGLIGP